MYSLSLGRFLEEDSYLGDGRNLYIYVGNNPIRYIDPSGYCKQLSTAERVAIGATVAKWTVRGVKVVAGVALVATGAGAGAGVALLTSVAVDVASEVMVEAVVAIADVCGADEKTKVIVSDVTQGVLGGVLIFTGADVVTGAAMVGSGAGGLVGGYAAEAVYEYATDEDSDIAFMYGSAAGNIIGGIAGGKIGKTADESLKVGKQAGVIAESSDSFVGTTNESGKISVNPEFEAWLNKGEADNKVYFGIKAGEAQYTGITKQSLNARLSQHNANGKGFQRLDQQLSGLTRNQARAIEQYYIENGPNNINKINSISKDNKFYQEAMNWAKDFLGEK